MKELNLEAGREVALRFLGVSARSRSEIERRLQRDEFPVDVIEQVIGEMEALGYLNDEQFAKDWIADRADRKRYGKTRLAAELSRKGIERDVAKEALASIDPDDEAARARKAAEAKWDRDALATLDIGQLQAEKRRITSFLQRRGFSWQTITKVLADLTVNKE